MTAGHRLRHGGFSLVELMVSVVIGLVALLFTLRLFASAEQGRQSTLGGSDALQNGMVALFSLAGDAGQAGFGINDSLIAGCDTRFYDASGYELAPALRGGSTSVHPLAPIVIESNGAAPDRITFYAGSAPGGTPTLRLLKDYTSGTQLSVDNKTYGFLPGHVIVVAPEAPGGGCALAQVSGLGSDADGPLVMIAAGGANRYNNGSLGASYTHGAARLFDLGPAASLSFHTWSVGDGYLQLRSTGAGGSSAAPAAVTDNIVSLKAQYGFDTRGGAAFQPASGLRVNTWSAAMLDADGSGVAGDAGDYQRIAAVRLGVVARARNVERTAAGATCTTTSAKPVLFATAQPPGTAAVPVTVDTAVSGDPVDWRCYRYRVFETVVPLRNASWRP